MTYLDFVKDEAVKQGKVFMLDSGEGKDFYDPLTHWEIEDLSGWLIQPDMQVEIVKASEKGNVRDLYQEYYVFATWTRNGEGRIGVQFNSFQNYEQ